MTKKEKTDIFKNEIENIKNETIKKSCIDILESAPDYFFEIPASSTGKYHPQYALGSGGLIRHTKAVVRFVIHLCNIIPYSTKFTNDERDLLIVAAIAHDMFKNGATNTKHTVNNHPLLSANNIKKICTKLSENEVTFLYDAIKCHMGSWSENDCKPSKEHEYFLHICDYLASRKDIEVLFDESKLNVINNDTSALNENQNVPIEKFRLPFGKNKNKLLSECDVDYLKWAYNNMTFEPTASIIKEYCKTNNIC